MSKYADSIKETESDTSICFKNLLTFIASVSKANNITKTTTATLLYEYRTLSETSEITEISTNFDGINALIISYKNNLSEELALNIIRLYLPKIEHVFFSDEPNLTKCFIDSIAIADKVKKEDVAGTIYDFLALRKRQSEKISE